ncbi:MAG: transaldolase/EF-hand protein [Armatimonadetes bacterium]|jgi:Ca2+-binding EF-hand superfamily protein|nr:transaldolase/EF-hand protein [Armatimonadota bacterium]
MEKSFRMIAAVVAALAVGSGVLAQGQAGTPGEGRPEGAGTPGGERRGPGAFLRRMPVMLALDLDKNGELSADEISRAAASLATLDKNKDGKLTEDELRPTQEGGPGGPGGGAPVGPATYEIVDRLMEFDANKDGKLTKAEAPARLRGLFERADANKDGLLTRDELTRFAESTAPRPAPAAPGGAGAPPAR